MEIRDSLPEELLPYEAEFFASMREGLKTFVSRFGGLRPAMTTRSERSNIHDCLVEEIKKRLPWMFQKHLFLVKIGSYRIKPKKVDDALRSRNQPTQLVMDFLKQVPLTLFDVGPTVNLILGYQPNGIDLASSALWVICPDGGRVNWAYELRDGAASAVIPSPVPQPSEPSAPRVTPKAKPAIAPNVANKKE